MPAVREQILAALKARLLTIPGISGRVYRNRDIPATVFPSINILGGSHETEPVASVHVTAYRMDLMLELYTSAGDSEAAEVALHALYSNIIKKIRTDETFGGLAIQTDELGMDEPEPGRMEGQGPTCAARADFLIHFWTLPNDPDSVAP